MTCGKHSRGPGSWVGQIHKNFERQKEIHSYFRTLQYLGHSQRPAHCRLQDPTFRACSASMAALARLVPVATFLLGLLFGRLSVPACGPLAPASPSTAGFPPGNNEQAPSTGRLTLGVSHEPRDPANALLRRVYPLYDEAQPWDTVPFAKYEVILVTGTIFQLLPRLSV